MKHLSRLFLLLLFLSCSSEEGEINNIVASFEISSNQVLIGDVIKFNNTSSANSSTTIYEWNFGDGNTSIEKSPTHIYSSIGNGILMVELKLIDGSQESNSVQEITLSFSNDLINRKTLTEKLSDTKILTCAHRGNHNNAPENSLKSIQDAIDKQIEMVEIDVRQTKDGKFVLMHDSTLERTTNGSGNVSDYTLEELKQLKLKDNRGVITNEKVPTLQEAFVLGRGKIYFDLDISNDKVSFDRIYPVVKQYGMIKQSLFYTQGVSITKSALNKDADVIAMPVISDEDRLNQFENNSLVKVAHFQSQTFNQNFVTRAKAKGWYIFMNAYVNTTKSPLDDNYNEIDKISNLGGNIIQTDFPVLVKEHLK